ncbi:MAG: CCA tRNA nucleotidyltransferase, partial [Methylobacteriaceae bacterium]|nr:CCA tRNA nucleotidyltransferase [Methylobacteriaceae bacterium]
LGEAPTDVDIAATATPDVVEERARRWGFHTAPTGVEHGTITVIVAGRPFEVTTLREDVETFGRKAKVRFGRDFAADALRRDFTINALSATREGLVHDYAGGLDDLAARRVRFIGDARARIREDYLRILRLLRFHARYGEGPIDRSALAAAIAEREGLDTLSRERVRAELMKLIDAPGAAGVLVEADGAGFLTRILGGLAYPARFAALREADRRGAGTSETPLRLAALAVLVREDAERLRAALRLSNSEHARLAGAARAREALIGGPPPVGDAVVALLFEHGRVAARDGLRLAECDAAPDQARGFALARRALEAAADPVLPFRGADLLERGVKSGRAVGQTLKELQAAWIRAGFPQDPATLARLLDEAVARMRARRG